MEHVTVSGALGSRCRREVATTDAVYLAALEEGGGGTEDEVNSALYVAVLVVLLGGFAVCVQRVLIAKETAAHEDGAVACHEQRHGLPHRTGVVGEGDVESVEVVAVNVER